ncbi:hypothetical protein IFM89_024593 [Coptis chinensis]|uniref:DNA polymerase epsilon catalytic subunit n=1 Tax=Coptis chinensis TaxID=261450 RepID=A0A835IDG7_9MAGN|nr:hypothetical protein IFM89_024593 [Coptis chinensis]
MGVETYLKRRYEGQITDIKLTQKEDLNLCVWEDIEDLEYTPKPEFEGYFKVKNVKNEVSKNSLDSGFAHMREVKPGIYVTYNGDFFDWSFLETRAAHHGMVMNNVLNIKSWVAKPTDRQPKAQIALYVVAWFYLKAARANDEVDKTTKYLAVLSLLGHERIVLSGWSMEDMKWRVVEVKVLQHMFQIMDGNWTSMYTQCTCWPLYFAFRFSDLH